MTTIYAGPGFIYADKRGTTGDGPYHSTFEDGFEKIRRVAKQTTITIAGDKKARYVAHCGHRSSASKFISLALELNSFDLAYRVYKSAPPAGVRNFTIIVLTDGGRTYEIKIDRNLSSQGYDFIVSTNEIIKPECFGSGACVLAPYYNKLVNAGVTPEEIFLFAAYNDKFSSTWHSRVLLTDDTDTDIQARKPNHDEMVGILEKCYASIVLSDFEPKRDYDSILDSSVDTN